MQALEASFQSPEIESYGEVCRVTVLSNPSPRPRSASPLRRRLIFVLLPSSARPIQCCPRREEGEVRDRRIHALDGRRHHAVLRQLANRLPRARSRSFITSVVVVRELVRNRSQASPPLRFRKGKTFCKHNVATIHCRFLRELVSSGVAMLTGCTLLRISQSLLVVIQSGRNLRPQCQPQTARCRCNGPTSRWQDFVAPSGRAIEETNMK
jgi:hypothetical protein